MTRPVLATVYMEVPDDATDADVLAHLEATIPAVGYLPPEGPMFDLDRSTIAISVKTDRRRRRRS